jgi:hypothetical protein
MADGPDVLIWRMAADAMNLAVGTTRGLCNAVEVHESARPIAMKRVATLRTMGAMLLQCANDFDSILAGGDDRSLDEIVSSFAREFGKGLDEPT